NNCAPGAFKKAEEVGYQIAKQGAVLMSGATIGIPEWATRGAKKGKGMSIGFSPASTKREHLNTYRLPLTNMDLVIYTGADYSGRNLILTRSADAVIEICGRVGTLNEFTIAFEDQKPIGILTNTGGTSELIDEILTVSRRGRKGIVFDDDPAQLVKKLIALLKDRDKKLKYFQRPNIKLSME
ncbi:MAG: hypothetical protein M3Q64_01760, partial [bacterium]|nr:hypothetical protein [bacterium]